MGQKQMGNSNTVSIPTDPPKQRVERHTNDYYNQNTSELISNFVAQNKVMIFSATYCPYCRVASKQFDKLNEPYKKLEMDTYFESKLKFAAAVRELSQITDGLSFVPKVFVCGRYIGGGSEAKQLFEAGKLKELVDNCEKSYDNIDKSN